MARETYFPHLAILVPKRQSCACLRGQYALRKITRHSNHVPAAEQRPRHRRCPTSRDFVPWRFSDAGRHSSWIASSCRHPKTCTTAEVEEQPQGGPFGLISSLHGGGRGRRESGHRATLVPGPV